MVTKMRRKTKPKIIVQLKSPNSILFLFDEETTKPFRDLRPNHEYSIHTLLRKSLILKMTLVKYYHEGYQKVVVFWS